MLAREKRGEINAANADQKRRLALAYEQAQRNARRASKNVQRGTQHKAQQW